MGEQLKAHVKFRRPLNIKSSDSLLYITAEINYIYDVSLSFQRTGYGDQIMASVGNLPYISVML
jgi:hypothetical protein